MPVNSDSKAAMAQNPQMISVGNRGTSPVFRYSNSTGKKKTAAKSVRKRAAAPKNRMGW